MMETDLARIVHQLMQAKPALGRAQRGMAQFLPQAFDVQSQGAARDGAAFQVWHEPRECNCVAAVECSCGDRLRTLNWKCMIRSPAR